MVPRCIVNNFRQERRPKRAKMRRAFVVFVVNVAGHLAPIELRILVSTRSAVAQFSPLLRSISCDNRIVSRAPIVRREISGCRVSMSSSTRRRRLVDYYLRARGKHAGDGFAPDYAKQFSREHRDTRSFSRWKHPRARKHSSSRRYTASSSGVTEALTV